MEYRGLANLDNTYPQPGNYIPNKSFVSEPVNKKAQINLFGQYADKNKLPFTTKTLSDLKFVEGTNFRFILAIFKDYEDTNPIYYTSEQYYNDLESALIEGNPYFLQASFDSRNIVSFVYEDVLKIHKSMRDLEYKSRIDFRSNIFITSGSVVNYDNLVTYIDWLVDKPSPLDDENFGVLQPETIAGWDALDGNFSTGQILNTVSASYGIGSEFVLVGSNNFGGLSTSEAEKLKAEKELKAAQEKEAELNTKINNLKEAIRTKVNYQYPRSENAYCIVDGGKFSSSESGLSRLFGSKRTREDGITAALNKAINELSPSLNRAKEQVSVANANLNDIKSKAENAVNKANELKDKAQKAVSELQGKIPAIPKIPKLPPIPKIPKLPAVSDVLALLPIPAIPALPKLPGLPKFGKPKLPKLPKIKLKKPKEPKKVKKNKGKGLKGALAGLQDAANSVQGAIAGATAAAAGAVASAQNAANAAQQQAAAAKNAVQNAQNAVKGAVQNAQSSVQNAVSNTQNAVKGAVQNAKSSVQNTIDNTKNNLPKI